MPSAHPTLPTRVVVYGRSGCHLCHDAEAVVARVCRQRGIDWRAVAIDDDPALLTAYAELIPVIEVDGVEVARWRITEQELHAALNASG